MAYTIKHKFQTNKADSTDATLVKPTDWNADHILTMDEGTVIGRPPGSGTGPAEEIPIASLRMPGEMVIWPGLTAPAGWMLCQGQSLVRTEFPILFGVLGTNYGSADGSHFNLPDMRGRVGAGLDAGAGRLTTATVPAPNVPGGAGGQQTEAAGVSGSISGSASGTLSGGYAGGLVGDADGISGNAFLTTSSAINVSGTLGVGGSFSGASVAVTNVQPTLMVNYMIKVDQ